MFEQIPADLVVNALLAAMTKHAQTPRLKVYQVASSVVNPMSFNILADVSLELFTKDPMMDKNGQPIRVQRMNFVQSMTAFNLYLWFVYQLPLKVRPACTTCVFSRLASVCSVGAGLTPESPESVWKAFANVLNEILRLGSHNVL